MSCHREVKLLCEDPFFSNSNSYKSQYPNMSRLFISLISSFFFFFGLISSSNGRVTSVVLTDVITDNQVNTQTRFNRTLDYIHYLGANTAMF